MIKNPIAYKGNNLNLVREYEALPPEDKSGELWNDQRFSGVKSAIKTYYRDVQANYCCYCAKHNPVNHGRAWDTDHVADKNKYPHFMFTPANLAASCPDCNGYKGDKEVFKNPGRKGYPTDGQPFKIVHPHFDNYDDHIANVGYVYVAKTSKGSFTIHACNLFRFSIEHFGNQDEVIDTRFEEEIEKILSDDDHAAEEALRVLLKALKRR